jgi:pSer/pThr/pTyr-binding forkhead associated (FHA) protein
MKVEKKHAYIKRVGGKKFQLVNNGAPPEQTLVNETPVRQTKDLQDGDRIQLGNIILKFQMREAVNRARKGRAPIAAAPAGS